MTNYRSKQLILTKSKFMSIVTRPSTAQTPSFISLNKSAIARRAAIASFAGAVVDWYDFLLYGITAALVFNHVFFPQISSSMATLVSFATFGVGFLFRPLGGLIFGHFGDKFGRKRMLMLTVWIMGGATAAIGLLPSFATIGWWSPILLVIFRALQGFAVGGEWGGAATLAVEHAPPVRQAFYSSGVQVGYGIGLLLATGLVSFISELTTDQQFIEWGWRIPFLFSVLLVIGAILARRGLTESNQSEDNAPSLSPTSVVPAKSRIAGPLLQAIKQRPLAFIQIIALRFCELLTMYIVTTFALNYSVQHMNLSRELFLNLSLLAGALSCLTIPLFALLADHFGYRPIYIAGALTGTLAALPFFLALEQQNALAITICALLLINLAHDLVVSVQQPLFTAMFGKGYRYSGAGVGYQLASVIGGGFTPFIASVLVTLGAGSWHGVALLLISGCMVSLIAACFIRVPRADQNKSNRRHSDRYSNSQITKG